MCLGISLLALDASAQPKIKWLVFGDFFDAARHRNPAIKGNQGLSIRRINAWADHVFSSELSGRLRLEAASPGDFRGDWRMQPLIKDFYVSWKKGQSSIRVGLIPTLPMETLEGAMGYRYLEKSPLDLYRLVETRDQGLSATIPVGKRTQLSAMLSNAVGTRGRQRRGAVYAAKLTQKLTDQVQLEIYGDYQDRADSWRTAQANLTYVAGPWKAALLWAAQQRTSAAVRTYLAIGSLYVSYQANERWTPFLRLDVLSGPVPGAARIPYLSMAPTGAPRLISVGAEGKIRKNFKVAPNVEIVTYERSGLAPRPKTDVFFRLTFVVEGT